MMQAQHMEEVLQEEGAREGQRRADGGLGRLDEEWEEGPGQPGADGDAQGELHGRCRGSLPAAAGLGAPPEPLARLDVRARDLQRRSPEQDRRALRQADEQAAVTAGSVLLTPPSPAARILP